jgi:hypothetical protein
VVVDCGSCSFWILITLMPASSSMRRVLSAKRQAGGSCTRAIVMFFSVMRSLSRSSALMPRPIFTPIMSVVGLDINERFKFLFVLRDQDLPRVTCRTVWLVFVCSVACALVPFCPIKATRAEWLLVGVRRLDRAVSALVTVFVAFAAQHRCNWCLALAARVAVAVAPEADDWYMIVAKNVRLKANVDTLVDEV